MAKRFRLFLTPLVTILLLLQSVMPGIMAQDATPVIPATEEATATEEIGTPTEAVTETPVEPEIIWVTLNAPVAPAFSCSVTPSVQLTNAGVTEGVASETIEGVVVAGSNVVVRVVFDVGYGLSDSSTGWTTQEDGSATTTVVVPDCTPAKPTKPVVQPAVVDRVVGPGVTGLTVAPTTLPSPSTPVRLTFTWDVRPPTGTALSAGDKFEFDIANYDLLGYGANRGFPVAARWLR